MLSRPSRVPLPPKEPQWWLPHLYERQNIPGVDFVDKPMPAATMEDMRLVPSRQISYVPVQPSGVRSNLLSLLSWNQATATQPVFYMVFYVLMGSEQDSTKRAFVVTRQHLLWTWDFLRQLSLNRTNILRAALAESQSLSLTQSDIKAMSQWAWDAWTRCLRFGDHLHILSRFEDQGKLSQFGDRAVGSDPDFTETVQFPQALFGRSLDYLSSSHIDWSSPEDLPKAKIATLIKSGKATYDFTHPGNQFPTVDWNDISHDLDNDIADIRRLMTACNETDLDMLYEKTRTEFERLIFESEELNRGDTTVASGDASGPSSSSSAEAPDDSVGPSSSGALGETKDRSNKDGS